MYLRKLIFFLWNVALIEHMSAYPDKYEIQDADTNKKFDLLDLLKDYEESDKEHRRDSTEEPLETWTGRWMPQRPNEPTLPPKVLPSIKVNETEYKNVHHDTRIPMGVKTPDCDDGKSNLTIDWDYSASSLTCYGQKIEPDLRLSAKLMCKTIPKNYVAAHKCMHEIIEYNEDIPLYGTHRPVWPVYGEYIYVPKQRWLHNLEHGAIVMLYHPCANQEQVKLLKIIVKGCLRRHIITPYNLLDEERPLALLSWGCILSMSSVNKDAAVKFIKEYALTAPEKYVKRDGDFNDQLKEAAKTVSDEKDSVLCPNM